MKHKIKNIPDNQNPKCLKQQLIFIDYFFHTKEPLFPDLLRINNYKENNVNYKMHESGQPNRRIIAIEQ